MPDGIGDAPSAGMVPDQTMPMAVVDGLIVPLPRLARRTQLGRFGDLEVQTPLARGGMGGVYLAVHRETRERVALKVLDPQFAAYPEVVARLFAEHTVAASVAHPGLIEIREARFTNDGIPYLVMEHLEGETLGALADRGEIDISTIIAVTAQVAYALAALHAVGYVHCDVKHDNVFVTTDVVGGWPRIKVIDFGVSRAVDEPPLADAAIAGTPWCMAPEQWSGAPTPRSDVYALGCMLYDLTTGAPPFDGSLPELMMAHLEQRPARPSWLRAMPIELERIILRALAKDPDARPTMHDIAIALSELVDQCTPVELRRAG